MHSACTSCSWRAVTQPAVRNLSGFMSKLSAAHLLHPALPAGTRKFKSFSHDFVSLFLFRHAVKIIQYFKHVSSSCRDMPDAPIPLTAHICDPPDASISLWDWTPLLRLACYCLPAACSKGFPCCDKFYIYIRNKSNPYNSSGKTVSMFLYKQIK